MSYGIKACYVEGGFDAWSKAHLPLTDPEIRSQNHRWVLPEKPSQAELACCWFIRRFVDRSARFLFVSSSQVDLVVDRFAGARIPDVKKDECPLRKMLALLNLETDALNQLAKFLDTSSDERMIDLDVASLPILHKGLFRMYGDVHELLETSMTIFDGLYRGCHNGSDNISDRGTAPFND